MNYCTYGCPEDDQGRATHFYATEARGNVFLCKECLYYATELLRSVCEPVEMDCS